MVMTTDVDWVVISLRRTPERLESFRAINGNIDLPMETLEAVDGQQLDRDEVVRSGLLGTADEWGTGAIGAALSHRLCWLRAVETGRHVGILEDDVYLRHDFVERLGDLLAEMPPGWDILHLGFNTDAILDLAVIPGCNARGGFTVQYPTKEDCELFARSSGCVTPVRFHNAFGNCAYVVSPGGAQKFLDGCFPLNMDVVVVPAYEAYIRPHSKDVLMNRLYRGMSAYLCMPPIVMPLNDKPASTVQA